MLDHCLREAPDHRQNQNRVFIHFHGGAYVINPGEPGTREGALMAGFGHTKVISVRAHSTELLAKAQQVENKVGLPGPAASAPTLRA